MTACIITITSCGCASEDHDLLLQLVLGTHADLATHGIGYHKCCEWAKTVHAPVETKKPRQRNRVRPGGLQIMISLSQGSGPPRPGKSESGMVEKTHRCCSPSCKRPRRRRPGGGRRKAPTNGVNIIFPRGPPVPSNSDFWCVCCYRRSSGEDDNPVRRGLGERRPAVPCSPFTPTFSGTDHGGPPAMSEIQAWDFFSYGVLSPAA